MLNGPLDHLRCAGVAGQVRLAVAGGDGRLRHRQSEAIQQRLVDRLTVQLCRVEVVDRRLGTLLGPPPSVCLEQRFYMNCTLREGRRGRAC